MSAIMRPVKRVFTRGSWAETSRITDILRRETIGGALLLVAALAALIWANSPWSDSYHALRGVTVGTDALGLHLNLSLGAWAADGLLAVFFFVVGLELKREFVAGDLRDPARAALPVAAAVGGMIVPAGIYLLVINAADADAANGWAIPTATDIAFAVAVLAVIATHLPAALRTFLLTVAVVDDLLAITVIAVFYTDQIQWWALAGAAVPLALFTLCVQRRFSHWWLLLPLAAATWVLMHESGVHATVAGVLLGFAVPVLRGTDERQCLSDRFEHLVRPISAGLAVPVFAFFAAGVTVGGFAGFTSAISDPVTVGIIAGLVIGKGVGIFGSARLLTAFTRARLDDDLAWVDVFGVALLGGIGFTVSLLIGELAFDAGSDLEGQVKIGVLVGSILAATIAAVILKTRNRHYRRVRAVETVDADDDGVPDVYEESSRRLR
ncbi:Na+/H+ antiporter NhaA [Mycobacterium sp. djl-10]|nr:Na+/H+ antiporter NhaA [Mycobacterium sp. djl-10]